MLLLGSPFANAAAVVHSLGESGSAPGALTFVHGLTLNDLGPGQPGGLEYAGQILLAYANLSGNVVIADLDIGSTARTIFSTTAGSFSDATDGRMVSETIAVSDLVTLTGVSLAGLQTQNIHFVA